ncbi:MAG: hypothetical protein ACYCUI_11545 [Vulcanimicrobiaceae bacterium]
MENGDFVPAYLYDTYYIEADALWHYDFFQSHGITTGLTNLFNPGMVNSDGRVVVSDLYVLCHFDHEGVPGIGEIIKPVVEVCVLNEGWVLYQGGPELDQAALQEPKIGGYSVLQRHRFDRAPLMLERRSVFYISVSLRNARDVHGPGSLRILLAGVKQLGR